MIDGFRAVLAAVGFSACVAAAQTCDHDQICGLKGPEDLILLPGSHWAIAGRLAKDTDAPGGFSLVDLEARTARVLMPDVSKPAAAEYSECPGAPDLAGLVTHGIDLRRKASGPAELFAVNHGGRESIEIFDVSGKGGDTKLTWKGCVLVPSDMSTNAVAALPGGLAVTSFGAKGEQGTADLMAGKPSGFVATWAPKKGWAHVPGSEFGGDNGIAAARDGSVLYVNDWADGTLRILPLKAGGATQTILLGSFHPDNVHWMSNGNLLIAGQIGMPRDMMECFQKPTCPVGSMIVVVSPRTGKVLSRQTVEGNGPFGAASVAVPYKTDFWLGSFRGDRILRVGSRMRKP